MRYPISLLIVLALLATSSWAQTDWKLRAALVGDPDGNYSFGWQTAATDRWMVTLHEQSSPILRVFDGATLEFLYQLNIDVNLSTYRDEFDLEIDGDTLYVGAPLTTVNGRLQAGAVQVWDLVDRAYLGSIYAPQPIAWAEFGWSIDFSGDLMVIGEPFGTGVEQGSGAAYIFDIPTRTMRDKLIAGDGVNTEAYGWDVGIEGDRVIVGRPDDTGFASAVFLYDSATGTELATMTPVGLEGWSGAFGQRIDIDGGRVLAYYNAWDGDSTDTAVAQIHSADDGELERVWQIHSWSGEPFNTWIGDGVLAGGRYAYMAISPEEEPSFVDVYDTVTGQKLDRINNPGGDRIGFGYYLAAFKNRLLVWSYEDGGFQPGHLDVYLPRLVHYLGLGFDDGGHAGNGGRAYRGDIGAETMGDVFSNLNSIYVSTDRQTFAWDANASDPSDGDAAWTAIQNRINATLHLFEPDDLLIIYLATHGNFLDEPEGDEAVVRHAVDPFTNDYRDRGTDELIHMGSGHYITDDHFRNFFEKPELEHVNKLFLTDMCYSGGLWGTSFNPDSGEFGDLSSLPRTALIAAVPETEYAVIEDTTRMGYFTLGLKKTLEDLDAANRPLTFKAILTKLRSLNGFVRQTYSNGNGDLEGILAGPFDFSHLYGHLVPGDFNPVGFSTSDFVLNPIGGNGGLQSAQPRP